MSGVQIPFICRNPLPTLLLFFPFCFYTLLMTSLYTRFHVASLSVLSSHSFLFVHVDVFLYRFIFSPPPRPSPPTPRLFVYLLFFSPFLSRPSPTSISFFHLSVFCFHHRHLLLHHLFSFSIFSTFFLSILNFVLLLHMFPFSNFPRLVFIIATSSSFAISSLSPFPFLVFQCFLSSFPSPGSPLFLQLFHVSLLFSTASSLSSFCIFSTPSAHLFLHFPSSFLSSYPPFLLLDLSFSISSTFLCCFPLPPPPFASFPFPFLPVSPPIFHPFNLHLLLSHA